MVVIHIHRATGLASCDLNGTSDPFIRVFYNEKEVGSTSHIRRTLNPEWNSAVEFDLTNTDENHQGYVVLEVWDRDDLSSNDQICACRLHLNTSNHEKEFKLALVKGPRPQGFLYVTASYSSNDKEVLESSSSSSYQTTDIRDLYPPHNIRFQSLYTLVPASIARGSASNLSVFTIPQNELLCHMVEEVTLTFHLMNRTKSGKNLLTEVSSRTITTSPLATMVLSTHRLWFIPYSQTDIVHTIAVAKISKIYTKLGSDTKSTMLHLETKDGCFYTAMLSSSHQKRLKTLLNVIAEIEWLQCENNFALGNTNRTHTLEKKNDPKIPPPPSCRKNYYSILKEYKRLLQNNNTGAWRITAVNDRYTLCPTYPSHLIVPSNILDETLFDAASYRSKSRLPVLTWLHPTNFASICRSSQPKSGLLRADNELDTALIWAIRNTNLDSLNQNLVHIIDARPEINAKGNALAGKGHESSRQYFNRTTNSACARIVFMGIDNIHVVRTSFKMFSEAFFNADDANFFNVIHKSHWYEHVASILLGGVEITNIVAKGESVLVHCSDGWDRTSQLASLAQLMLDPFYRTIDGFATLIEKDWCSFGHRFHTRSFSNSDQESPIFLLFLDATYQLLCQFPSAFQFNNSYLLAIVEGLYNSWYGNFLDDCESMRRELPPSSSCIWHSLRAHTDTFINPLYNPEESTLVIPDTRVRNMTIWSGLYQKAVGHVKIQKKDEQLLHLIQTQEEQINSMALLLTSKQKLELRKKALESEIITLGRGFELDHLDRNEIESTADLMSPIMLHRQVSTESSCVLEEEVLNDSRVEELQVQLQELQVRLEEKNIAASKLLEEFRNSDDVKSSISAPVWQEDHDAGCCKQCRKKFKMVLIYRARHHCRLCGFIFCGKCSNYFLPIPELGYYEKVRVCVNCNKQQFQNLTNAT